MSASQYTTKDILRFWSKVAVTANPDLCWEWQSSLMHKGYGQFHFEGKIKRTHRVAYEITHGSIPDGLHVLHTCDNRKCCNPAHLFLGTTQKNTQDMVNKGRQARGEKCARHILTSEKVEIILTRYENTDITQQKLADEFEVSLSAISGILTGRRWKHIKVLHDNA